MRRNIEKIEIQEPPIQELTKKNSCVKRSCTTGCGCIVIFLIASMLLLKFAAGPRIKELKNVPENFPQTIPLYDTDNITKITFISGKEKNRGLEMAAFVPKIILSPILLMLSNETNNPDDPTKADTFSTKANWNNLINLIKEPVSDQRDLIKIEWTDLTAESKFIHEYYTNELKKNDFILKLITFTDTQKQLSFSKEQIEGVIFIADDPDTSGTNTVTLTINLPTEK